MIYRYFHSKNALFDAVFDAMVVQSVHEVPLDATDLAGYAVRLWDKHRSSPQPIRVSEWDRLERDGAGFRLPVVLRANSEKVTAIRDAQITGSVPSDLTAEELTLTTAEVPAVLDEG